MQYRKERVPMGATVQINEFERNVTTQERVKATIAQITEWDSTRIRIEYVSKLKSAYYLFLYLGTDYAENTDFTEKE